MATPAEIEGVPTSPGTATSYVYEPTSEASSDRAPARFPNVEAERVWIAERIAGIVKSEEDHREPHKRKWEANQRLMNNEHDFTGKADWQSQLVISKVPNAVNAQMAILKGGLVQTKDWFDMDAREGSDPLDASLLGDLKDLLRAELEERDPYTRRDFLDEWLLALKGGLVNSTLVMKFYPVEDHRRVRVFKLAPVQAEEREDGEEENGFDAIEAQTYAEGAAPAGAPATKQGVTTAIETRSYTRIVKEGVPTRDYFWDSTGRRKYEFQRIQGDLDELNRMTAEAGYLPKKIAEAKAKATATVPKSEDERISGRPSESAASFQARVGWEGIEFYGDLQGPDGELLRRNATLTIIEGVVVRDKPNPFDDGAPYRACQLEPMADSTYGRAPLENAAGVAHFITELANAIVDATTYEVLKMWEIDLEQLDAMTDLTTGAFPSKLWYKRDRQGSGKPMMSPIDTGRTPQGAITLLAFFDRQFQEGTNVTEISQGLQPIRGFPTATEISARQQNTNTAFRALAQWAEKGSLEPCLEAVFNRMLQFKVFGEGGPEWCAKVLGKERADLFYQKLYARVQQDGTFEVSIEFRVYSLSAILARASEIERISRVLDVIRQFPGIANRIDLNELSRRVIDTLGYSSEELMKTDEELAQVDAMEQEALKRLTMAAGQQPNSHTGNATAAAGIATPAGA